MEIPGKGDERGNRLAGLGPLSGIAVGVAVGVAVGAAAGLLLSALRKHGIAPPCSGRGRADRGGGDGIAGRTAEAARDQRPGRVEGRGLGLQRRSAPGLRAGHLRRHQRQGRSVTLALTRGRGYRFCGRLLTAAVQL